MPARTNTPHRKLSRSLIARAADLARKGLRPASIAAGIGVGASTLRDWLARARDGTGTPLELALLAALQEAQAAAEEALVDRLLKADDPATNRWLLTHGPWRESWSDAAAERRAVAACLASVVNAIAAAKLPPDDERRVLLHLQAAGNRVDLPVLELDDDNNDLMGDPPPPASPAHWSSRRYNPNTATHAHNHDN